MTAYFIATLRSLLLRSFSWSGGHAAPSPLQDWRDEHHIPETQPMPFRSEGFAEDLFDTHPSR